jgi:predicted lipoprotein with Yx(FWY)xxD motif
MLRSLARLKARNRRLWRLLALPAAAAAAALVVGCSSSGTSSGGSSGGDHAAPAASNLQTAKIGGATVLTNSEGFTLYSFGLDTSIKSNCNGQCATNWPPVKGPVTGSRIKGTFRHDQAIRRFDTSNLRRAPPVHLRRRHLSRPGQRQRPARVRRGVARRHHLR